MDKSIKKSDNIIKILHTNIPGIEAPKPFSFEVFLFETHIAGTSYINNIENIEKSIHIGDRLNFFREENNIHDNNAIIIKTINGDKIGYIPKKDNLIFSRLMDAGKLLFAKIHEIEKKDKWLKIKIKIYLDE